jgi:uncharacterized membrane protein
VSSSSLFYSIADQLLMILKTFIGSGSGGGGGSGLTLGTSTGNTIILNPEYLLTEIPSLMAITYIFWAIINNNTYKLKEIYIYMALIMAMVALFYPFVPSITNFVGEDRVIEITLMLTAPALVIGTFLVTSWKRVPGPGLEKAYRQAMAIVIAIVVCSVIVNSGVLDSLTNKPVSYAMDPSRVARANFGDDEWNGAQWYSQKVGYNDVVYADAQEAYLTKMWVGTYRYFSGVTEVGNMNETSFGTYTYLGPTNIYGHLWINDPSVPRSVVYLISITNSTFIHQINKMSSVYSSGRVMVFYNNTLPNQ